MTRYEFFRKRIAPVLFLGMVAWIAYDSCDAQQRTHSTIVIDLGAAEPRVKSVRAELVVGGEPIATFERRALPDLRIGCPCKFETAMPEELGQLRIEVELEGARRVHVTKPIHAIEGGTVKVPLEADLLPR